jgi:hypothetical protein
MSRREALEAVVAAITEIEGDGESWYKEHADWPTAEQIVARAYSETNPSDQTLHTLEFISKVAPHVGEFALSASSAA